METCARCLKIMPLCVCEKIVPVRTKVHILILQHPQEPDKELGTAKIANLCLPNSILKVGLSWPNLRAALGRETQPSRWAVCYLGSGIKHSPTAKTSTTTTKSPTTKSPTLTTRSPTTKARGPALQLVSKKGEPLPLDKNSSALAALEGIVLLDGTWSQAKALWWRNAWLLKLQRAIIEPSKKSLYGRLRKEPRPSCLSTLESIAETLTALNEPPEVSNQLLSSFSALLEKYREYKKPGSLPR